MASPRPSGRLVIRPCDVCQALVLHDESDWPELTPRRSASHRHWAPFPHRVPGGAICIGSGKRRGKLRASVSG